MKQITVERKVTEIMYEAVDGQKFKTEDACREHEKLYSVIIRKMFDDIPYVETEACNLFSPANDTPIRVIYPRNLDDIKVLNEYRQYITNENDMKYTTEDVGKFIVVEDGYDWVNHLGSVENVIELLQDKLMDMEKKLKDTLFPTENQKEVTE